MVEILKKEGDRQIMEVEKQWSLGELKGDGNKSSQQELREVVKEEIEARRHATQQNIHHLRDVFAKADPTQYKPRVCFSGPIHIFPNADFLPLLH